MRDETHKAALGITLILGSLAAFVLLWASGYFSAQ